MELNEKEIKKVNTIKKVLSGEINKEEAAELLEISVRQINRLIIKYNEEGENGFIHKNKGKESKKNLINT